MQHLPVVLFTAVALAGAVSVPVPAEPVKAEPIRPHSGPRGASAPQQCGCLNWKATYDQGLVKCGEGRELSMGQATLSPEANKDGTPAVQRKVCDDFFTRASFNQCLYMNPGADKDQWCYVDKQCLSLNGGGKLAQVSWKRCAAGAGGDSFLRDFSPALLYDMSKRHDVAFSDLVKMAYPGSKAGGKHSVSVDDFKKGVPVWVDQLLFREGLRGHPYWFDTNVTGALPAVLVVGSTAYKVDRRANAKLVVADRPGTWESLQCLVGCPTPRVSSLGAYSRE